jgi:hypothetical protein
MRATLQQGSSGTKRKASVSAICNTDQNRTNPARSYAVNFVTAPSTTPARSVIVSADTSQRSARL